MATLFHSASNVSISGGTFTAINSKTPKAASSVHDKLSAATASGALHDSVARSDVSRCHQGTRSKVLYLCERWAQGLTEEEVSVLWLLGGAGAGKSAIMQTVADWCASEGLLLAGFFFSRTDLTRNTADVLIPTLAYQLTQLYPSINEVINPIIEGDPLIFKKSVEVQLTCLLVKALLYLVQVGAIGTKPSLPAVFLIDALDECDDSRQQQTIIWMIEAVLYEHGIPVKFLISSRPDGTISDTLTSFQRRHQSLRMISLSNRVDAEADILKFIEDEFSTIREEHPFRHMIPSEWPSAGDIETLVAKSSSHFIYAATVMKYIKSPKDDPTRSLQVILGLQISRSGPPFADLDALYHHILGSATHLQIVLQILALCIFSRLPPFLSIISCMLGCPYKDVEIFLFDMAALIQVHYFSEGAGVQLLHASLGDFLTDQSRSQGLYIDESDYHSSSVARCFTLLDLFHQDKISYEYRWYTYEYSLLGDQIFHSITKLGGRGDILKQYNLQAFHDIVIRCEPEVDFDGLPESILNYVEAVRLAGFNDGGNTYRTVLEQFFDILQLNLEEDMPLVAPSILPMIFSGYSTTAVRDIIFHQGGKPYLNRTGTMSYLLTGKPTFKFTGGNLPSIFDNPNFRNLGINRHSTKASPEHMAVAAQVMLQYVSAHRLRAPFSKATLLKTPHKLWLQRRKPGEHITMGSQRLASAFHRRCHNYRLKDRLPPRDYLDKPQNYLGLLSETHGGVPQADICFFLILKAILWALPKAAHRDELCSYASLIFPRAVYQRNPKLVRKVLTCLVLYAAKVQEVKLSM